MVWQAKGVNKLITFSQPALSLLTKTIHIETPAQVLKCISDPVSSTLLA